MEAYKQEFIEFMVESQVLKFGEFTLKSGRKSPFFMNAGAYVTGSQLRRLGEYYAKAIHDNFGLDFDVLFGPAYKGIPLAVATAMAISELYGKDVRYCSNRKEEKDHGDAGILLGSKLKSGDRVVIIEDVTTSGKSIEETFPILKAQGDIQVKGLIVSLNRMERGKGEKSALEEIRELYGFDTASIVDMAEVTEYLYGERREYKEYDEQRRWMHIIVSMEQSRAAFHVVGGRAWISVQDEHRGKGGRMGISGTDQGQGWKERIYGQGADLQDHAQRRSRYDRHGDRDRDRRADGGDHLDRHRGDLVKAEVGN